MKGRLGSAGSLSSNTPSYASIIDALEVGENSVGDYLAVSAREKVYGTLKVGPVAALPGFTHSLGPLVYVAVFNLLEAIDIIWELQVNVP